MDNKKRLHNTILIIKKILEKNSETDSESYKRIVKLDKKIVETLKK